MKINIPLEIVSIENDGFHLMVKIAINGITANLLVDTGASKTVFDFKRVHSFEKDLVPELEKKFSTGLGTNSMQIHTVRIKKITLGELELQDFQAVLLDLSHVNDSYELIRVPLIDGVIGSDLLLQFNAVVDYKNKMLTLEV